LLIADGVTYESEEEWAVDRKLGKVGEAEPEMRSYRALAYLEEEIEQRVATIRAQRREARARSKRTLCAGCGKAFQAGDRYCARCGEAHPNSCPKCGERHHASDRYCTRCGMVLPRGAG
jgi:predicted amidophosphoribosyltransferase